MTDDPIVPGPDRPGPARCQLAGDHRRARCAARLAAERLLRSLHVPAHVTRLVRRHPGPAPCLVHRPRRRHVHRARRDRLLRTAPEPVRAARPGAARSGARRGDGLRPVRRPRLRGAAGDPDARAPADRRPVGDGARCLDRGDRARQPVERHRPPDGRCLAAAGVRRHGRQPGVDDVPVAAARRRRWSGARG